MPTLSSQTPSDGSERDSTTLPVIETQQAWHAAQCKYYEYRAVTNEVRECLNWRFTVPTPRQLR